MGEAVRAPVRAPPALFLLLRVMLLGSKAGVSSLWLGSTSTDPVLSRRGRRSRRCGARPAKCFTSVFLPLPPAPARAVSGQPALESDPCPISQAVVQLVSLADCQSTSWTEVLWPHISPRHIPRMLVCVFYLQEDNS